MKQILDFKDLANTTTVGIREDKKQGVQYTEIAKDGVYYTFDNGVMEITQKQHDIPEGIITGMVLPTIEERFELKDKVPFSFFLKILQFYYDVNKKYRTEVSAIIYRNLHSIELPQDLRDDYGDAYYEEDGFALVIPKQKNTPARSQFADINKELSDPLFEWCEDNLIGVAETHSHNTMNAFWSGTDDAYEKHNKLRMFMVVGQLGETQSPEYKVRYCFNQKYTDNLDLGKLFDVPKFTMGVQMEGSNMGGIFNKTNTEIPVSQAIKSIDLESKVIDYPEEDWMSKLINLSTGSSNITVGNYTQVYTNETESISESSYQQGRDDFKDNIDVFDLDIFLDVLEDNYYAFKGTQNIEDVLDAPNLDNFYQEVLVDMKELGSTQSNLDEEAYDEGFKDAVYNYLEDMFVGVSIDEVHTLMEAGSDALSFWDDLADLREVLEGSDYINTSNVKKEDLIQYISSESESKPKQEESTKAAKSLFFGTSKKSKSKPKKGFFSM